MLKLVLSGNNLTGTILDSLTKLSSLVLVDVSDNNIYGPVPVFHTNRVKVILTGNSNINNVVPPPASDSNSSPANGSSGSSSSRGKKSSISVGSIVGIAIGATVILLISTILSFLVFKRSRQRFLRVQSPNTVYMHPTTEGGSDVTEMVKITVTPSTANGEQTAHANMGHNDNAQRLEVGNRVISIELLRNVTKNFSKDIVLAKGGFGVVYKGEMDDGTKVAVKRMIASVISNKGLDEFQNCCAYQGEI